MSVASGGPSTISSPFSIVANKALYITCFPPQPTVISSGAKTRLFSLLNLLIIAVFNSLVPLTGVYLVCPFFIASIAAF